MFLLFLWFKMFPAFGLLLWFLLLETIAFHFYSLNDSYMRTVKKFEDLEVWKMARELCQEIFQITLHEAFARDFGLKNQIRDSSGSVMDNIAEGFERDGTREFVQFLSISKGSCGESRSQLYRALDRNYITNEQFEALSQKNH